MSLIINTGEVVGLANGSVQNGLKEVNGHYSSKNKIHKKIISYKRE